MWADLRSSERALTPKRSFWIRAACAAKTNAARQPAGPALRAWMWLWKKMLAMGQAPLILMVKERKHRPSRIGSILDWMCDPAP